jgi:hypothetical protein
VRRTDDDPASNSNFPVTKATPGVVIKPDDLLSGSWPRLPHEIHVRSLTRFPGIAAGDESRSTPSFSRNCWKVPSANRPNRGSHPREIHLRHREFHLFQKVFS